MIDHPAVVATRCFSRVDDYRFAAPDGAPWLTVHDLSAPIAELAGERDDTVIQLFEQVSPAAGWLTAEGVLNEGELPTGDAVLSVVMNVDADALDEFHGWYEEEHLPRLVAVPGINAARRFRATAGPEPGGGRRRFLALYEVARTDVMSSDAWHAASTVTPRTEQVVRHLSWASQLYRAESDVRQR